MVVGADEWSGDPDERLWAWISGQETLVSGWWMTDEWEQGQMSGRGVG